nr:hypothetical protein [Oikeobacillus pervagus]
MMRNRPYPGQRFFFGGPFVGGFLGGLLGSAIVRPRPPFCYGFGCGYGYPPYGGYPGGPGGPWGYPYYW